MDIFSKRLIFSIIASIWAFASPIFGFETDDYGYTVDITVTRNIFCHKTLKQGPGTCMETVLMIANKDLTIINEIMNKYNVENPKKY
ncbi:hypothetical protein RhiirA1_451358 [Rhizophagus irregularis]|uniref:Uncharacterized protein n=1 Tax=Rhizophagus irregularis TaxID=588596 RepID=A0A2N0SCN8_9GLOM|nr:hypothetical protein RhiirA1_451358 [Rhizophagus irregularis]